MRHVFISYVREDELYARRLATELSAEGIDVWIDRDRITPGLRWQVAIRQAIEDGAFFIACFSQHSLSRERSYMNEELIIAIEELRKRSAERAWFLPVLLHPGVLPERTIGGGQTLHDIQYVELHNDWGAGVASLLRVLRPSDGRLRPSPRPATPIPRSGRVDPRSQAPPEPRPPMAVARRIKHFRDGRRVTGTADESELVASPVHTAVDDSKADTGDEKLSDGARMHVAAPQPGAPPSAFQPELWTTSRVQSVEPEREAYPRLRPEVQHRRYESLLAENTRIFGAQHRITLSGRFDWARRVGRAGDAASAARLFASLAQDYAD